MPNPLLLFFCDEPTDFVLGPRKVIPVAGIHQEELLAVWPYFMGNEQRPVIRGGEAKELDVVYVFILVVEEILDLFVDFLQRGSILEYSRYGMK